MLQTFEWTPGGAGRIEIDGCGLEYRCHGPRPGEAPTVVMLHEGLGSALLWRDFPARLAAATGWGVLAYSRAGHGQSDLVDLPRPIDFMTREAEQVVPRLLDAIGFQSGVLLGHSDGATIAAIYAGSIEDFRVRGLILMAPHFFTEEMGLTEIARARDAYANDGLRDRMAKHHSDPDNTFRGWCDTWLDPEFKNWNVAEVIDYLRVPVLAIQGREDQYGTLAQIEEIENRSYAPVDVAILENCRHAPHLDQPERVLEVVTDYLERLRRIESEGFPEA
ncbi:alpha/beta fold hydrolase [Shimia sp.]|uniref:alpha/beta fold hydrolase n=1 Tax=Shimia sp. TaxID=1954381 RepID=UPI003568E16B